MKRGLRARMVVHPGGQRPAAPEYKKPELMATAPNQVSYLGYQRLLGPKRVEHLPLRHHASTAGRGLDGGGPGAELGPGRPERSSRAA